jgi:hypothetical protein
MRRMSRVRAVGACVLGVAALLVPAAALAQEVSPSPAASPTSGGVGEPRDQIVLSGEVDVRRGEDVGEVVVFHGSAVVSGVAHGDVVVIDGPIEVTGQVSGSVVGINGPVTIGPNAHVLGDVVARDRLTIADGATIEGRVREGTAFTFRWPIELFGPFAAWLALAFSTLVLGALVVLLAPRGVEAVAQVAHGSPWPTAGLGVGVAVGAPMLAALLLVSLVGLPLGVGLLLGLVLLFALGYVAAVFALGRALWRAPRSPWLALLVGWAIVAVVSAIPFVGGFLWIVGSVYGLGALTLATWRARGGRGRHRAGGKMTPARTEDGDVEVVDARAVEEAERTSG